MTPDDLRDLYGYHRWANRTLLDIATTLGEDVCARPLGSHFSFPTLTRTFAHIYGADWIWLSRWQGASPTRLPGDEFTTLAAVRTAWDAMEKEQKDFVDRLTADDLAREIEYRNTKGKVGRLPLGWLLRHVPDHATHHRSEVATMITMISGSPPDTGMVSYGARVRPVTPPR